jgi:hypothetical protein
VKGSVGDGAGREEGAYYLRKQFGLLRIDGEPSSERRFACIFACNGGPADARTPGEPFNFNSSSSRLETRPYAGAFVPE